jgi:hypothetical protein
MDPHAKHDPGTDFDQAGQNLSDAEALSFTRMLTPADPSAFGKFRVGRFDLMAL